VSWTPLFSDIVDSSVWRLPAYVRVAWITILAMKDYRTHKFRTNPYLLADKAKITEEEAEEALRIFQEPDKRSLNPDNEGRRIKQLENGEYVVLNGAIWSKKMAAENRRAWDRARKREERANGGELPPSFPMTEAEAVQQCSIVAQEVPAETIRVYYHDAAGRGGRDYRGTQILAWPNYVLGQWRKFGTAVPGTAAKSEGPAAPEPRFFDNGRRDDPNVVDELRKKMEEPKENP
jgi:hypothetical protein